MRDLSSDDRKINFLPLSVSYPQELNISRIGLCLVCREFKKKTALNGQSTSWNRTLTCRLGSYFIWRRTCAIVCCGDWLQVGIACETLRARAQAAANRSHSHMPTVELRPRFRCEKIDDWCVHCAVIFLDIKQSLSGTVAYPWTTVIIFRGRKIQRQNCFS